MTEALLEKEVSVQAASLPQTSRPPSGGAELWIDRHPRLAFAALTALFVVVVLALSSLKLLWLDELITLHIARLPDMTAIWRALSQGADPNPPITHILVHFSRSVFGEHEFALRLPAMIGYWIGLLSLFSYLVRRVPPVWALSGTVLSMTMAAFDYSFESRSYAIFYGFTMLAFLCWSETSSLNADRLRSRRFRILSLIGMTVALAAAISTNYFSVLAFLPIAAGEITRTLRSARRLRREHELGLGSGITVMHSVNFRIWTCLGLAATPLLIYRPLIAHSIAEFAPYAWNKVSLDQVYDSYTEMVEVILYPLLALFAFALAVALFARVVRPLCAACHSTIRPRWWRGLIAGYDSRLPIPLDEAVGVLFLLAYPFLGYMVANMHGGMLSPRFVIPVCFGFAIAGTVAAFQLFGRMPRAGLVFLCFYLSWFVVRESVVGYWYEEQKQCFYKVLNHLPEAERYVPANAPIVIPDPLLVLTFEHYASRDLVSRVVFPVDFPAIRLYRHDDSPEENLWATRNTLYHLDIVPIATLQQRTGKYLVIASDGNWLLNDLDRHHYPYQRLPINTRAVAIGGFTPLARGTPVFYTVKGDRLILDTDVSGPPPIPFHVADNLPNAAPLKP